MNYYYLISSLPALALETAPALTVETFREDCRRIMEDADFAELEAVLDGGDPDEGEHTPFVVGWRQAECQLRDALVRRRAERLGVDAGEYVHACSGYRMTIERGVSEAFDTRDPMKRELILDACRWAVAGELAGAEEPFALPAVLAYGIRLRLAERWAGLTRERGREQFEAISRESFDKIPSLDSIAG